MASRSRFRTTLFATLAVLVVTLAASTAIAKPGNNPSSERRSSSSQSRRATEARERRAAPAAARNENRGRERSSERRANPQAPPSGRGSANASEPGGASGARAGSSRTQSEEPPRGVAFSGTIKVSALPDPPDPSNDPHPGCPFRVDFFGFRAGTLTVAVRGVAPTPSGVLLTDSVTVDDARGNELNTSRTYTVSQDGIEPHPQQGFHLRVDVTRADKPGNGGKTKVFWLECAPAAIASSTSASRPTAALGSETRSLAAAETTVGSSGAGQVAVLGQGVTRLGAVAAPQNSNGLVAGANANRAAPGNPGVLRSILGNTGVRTATGLGLLALLAAGVLAFARRRHRPGDA